MDWNWFYSSTAQSIAAIVGLFGAFIISKVISNQNEYKSRMATIDDLLRKSNELKGHADNLDIKWLNSRARDRGFVWIDGHFQGYMKNGEVDSIALFVNCKLFSPYDNNEDLLRAIADRVPRLLRDQSTSHRTLPQPPEGYAEVKKEIDHLRVEIDTHRSNIKSFLRSIKNNPQSSRELTWSIIGVLIMFWFGVLLPLCCLPCTAPVLFSLNLFRFSFSIKSISLLISFVFFTLLMSYFIFLNSKLKYSDQKTEELTRVSSVEYYGEFLKNYWDLYGFLVKHQSLQANK